MRFLLLSLLSTLAFSESKLERFCAIRTEPQLSAPKLCEKPAGTPVRATLNRKIAGFFYAEFPDCTGYADNRCLEPEHRTEHASRIFGFGLQGNTGGLLARTTTETHTSGLEFGGYGIVTASIERFDFRLGLGYERLALIRKIDLTGQIKEPTETTFTQALNAWAGILGAGWNASPELQINLNLNYVLPFAASQTSTVGNEITYTSSDRYLFLSLGPAWRTPIADRIFLTLALEYAYNLGSTAGSELTALKLAALLEMR